MRVKHNTDMLHPKSVGYIENKKTTKKRINEMKLKKVQIIHKSALICLICDAQHINA